MTHGLYEGKECCILKLSYPDAHYFVYWEDVSTTVIYVYLLRDVPIGDTDSKSTWQFRPLIAFRTEIPTETEVYG